MDFNIKEFLKNKKISPQREDELMVILKRVYGGDEEFTYTLQKGRLIIKSHPSLKHYFKKNKTTIIQQAQKKDIIIRDIL
ncbi:hypothetical protein CL684_00305 [Candidatus Campbellbacteria bacterium]|nr:hypothetical protein [Candidatus Campbellbacteria bacterium]|tara:strand:+ start:1572 stop:1811 length:240 start_codon:yes stop_codon:yes gene_type:complete